MLCGHQSADFTSLAPSELQSILMVLGQEGSATGRTFFPQSKQANITYTSQKLQHFPSISSLEILVNMTDLIYLPLVKES